MMAIFPGASSFTGSNVTFVFKPIVVERQRNNINGPHFLRGMNEPQRLVILVADRNVY